MFLYPSHFAFGFDECSACGVRHLRDLVGLIPRAAVAHFYFSFNDIKKQKVVGMLASITKQLCHSLMDRPIPDAVNLLLQYKEKNEYPDIESLEKALLATVHEFTDVYVFIDAIDECPAGDG